tara:strand:- start:6 stop:329 length:324 start_codon:yes stop_codon:yes gene_type:complete
MKTQDTQEADGRGKYGSRNEAGYVSLAFKVVEQAVTDYKGLQALGVIMESRAVWPKTGSHKFLEYKSKRQVQELIGFFRSGEAEQMLSLINSKIDSGAMLRALGFSN